jgi:hypothetical protein
MRTILALFVLMFSAGAALSQPVKKGEPIPPPAGQIKTDFTYFEYWCLNVKSFSLDVVERKLPDGRVVNLARIMYVLEFQGDVPFLQLEPLQRNMRPDSKKLQHLFFDHENVALNGGQFLSYQLQGEVSGRFGESFRVTAEFLDDPRASILNTKKLVVRVPSPDLPTYGHY